MKAKITAVLLTATAAFLLPWILPSGALTTYVSMILAAIVVTGVSLLMGYSGQVTLGQGAFFAVGALTAALMSVNGFPPLLGLVCGPLAATLFSLAVGVPLLRLRGQYLAFGTLAMQIIVVTLISTTEWFGGPYGIQGIPQLGIFGFEITTNFGYAYVALAALALVLVTSRNLVHSRFGRGLRALSGSESAAASAGVPVVQYKISVFAISAAYAGLAGAIYPFFIGFVGPGSFPIMLSFQYIIMAVIGGLGTIWGGVVGAFLITLLVQGLNSLGTLPGMPSTAPAVLSYAVYATVLIVAVLLIPKGIYPGVMSIASRFTRGRRKRAVAMDVAPADSSHAGVPARS